MKSLILTLNLEKVTEHLNSIASSLQIPLLLYDDQTELLLQHGINCPLGCRTASGCLQGRHLDQIPLVTADKSPIFLATCSTRDENSAERLAAAASLLEKMLTLEYEIADLSTEVVRLYEEQNFIYNLTTRLGTDMDLENLCTRVLDEINAIMQVRNCSIMLLEKNNDTVSTRLSLGTDREAAAGFSFCATAGELGNIFNMGRPITICDISAYATLTFPYPVHSLLCIPLVTDGKSIGMLIATDKHNKQEFWSQELKMMGLLASEVAAAIRKAQLYEEINTLFMNTVDALASAIDAKDPYTYGHSHRVARISSRICSRMGLSKQQIREIELAAILHDIGKIGTPEQILQKPGRLDPHELEQIRRHPEQGAQILANIPQQQHVTTWIRHHHEWYNGNGYPDKLIADQIPVQSRIITIADTFDAMTSDRPYRNGIPVAEAIRIMEECSGSQLDPFIMNIFRSVLHTDQLDFCRPGCIKNALNASSNAIW